MLRVVILRSSAHTFAWDEGGRLLVVAHASSKEPAGDENKCNLRLSMNTDLELCIQKIKVLLNYQILRLVRKHVIRSKVVRA